MRVMRSYNLNIAGYILRFEAMKEGPELIPSERFLSYISKEIRSDILIKVYSGKCILPSCAELVFNAPYVEEINGIRIKNRDEFWNVYKHHNDLYISTILPLSQEEKRATLKFSLTSGEWELWFEGTENETDPLEYPLDGLILYYLSVIHGDILIHASGINNSGHGYIFSGISGKGKTTLAKLWNDSGVRIIHDDRLIIRKTVKGYSMFNTPVYIKDYPNESPLNKIFIIEHGVSNRMVTVNGATAVSLIMANCIQHNWSSDIIARLLGSVSIMCSTIPVVRLYFKPDSSAIEHILLYE
jgi:hypothetical protein